MTPDLTVQHTGGSYPIYIGSGLLAAAADLIGPKLHSSANNVILFDANVRDYKDTFVAGCKGDWAELEVQPGETSKSFPVYQSLLQRLLDVGIDRNSTVVAIGGGVVGDLAGFVAATFMRGIHFIQVPTTLLAQVDSSVGGKTGINLAAAKNSVGSFWQPQAVVIDPQVLRTLEPEQFTSGLAEVVKYGVIMDAEFFQFLENQSDAINQMDMDVLKQIIRRCCELKAEVVRQDERETSGRRAILNYGHTFGHAIESVFGYGTYPHGHAVAMGMHAAAHLACLLQQVDRHFVDRQARLLAGLQIPFQFPTENHPDVIAAMKKDKKTVGGDVRFILPNRLGDVQITGSIDQTLVGQAIDLASQEPQ